jgi:hypothetical protein
MSIRRRRARADYLSVPSILSGGGLAFNAVRNRRGRARFSLGILSARSNAPAKFVREWRTLPIQDVTTRTSL